MRKLFDDAGDAPVAVRSAIGRTTPRFWVKRFAIWESAEAEHPLRSVSLRPGLNIIWSPDPGDRGVDANRVDSPGHGGGKSLFCRLLRYCLGEAVPAVVDVRDKLVDAFPHAIVGCEFEIDGVHWALARRVARSIEGASAKERSLEQLVKEPLPRYGHHDGWNALSTLLGPSFGQRIGALYDGKPDERHIAWRAALTVLSRDQRSRVASITDWRERKSASGSPLTQLDSVRRLGVVCAALGIDATDFVRAVEAGTSRERERSVRKKQSEGRLASIAERVANIVGTGVPGADTLTPLDVDGFKKGLEKKLRELDEQSASRVNEDEADTARAAWLDAMRELAALRAKRDEKDELDLRIRDEIQTWSVKRDNAAGATCPDCGVSLVPMHQRDCPRRIASFWDEFIERLQDELRRTRAEREVVETQIAASDERLKVLDAARRAAQVARDTERERVAEQKGALKRKIEELERVRTFELPRAESADNDSAENSLPIGPLRESLRTALKPAAQRFERVLRFVYSNDARVRFEIVSDAIEPRVSIDGDLSTTAVDSVMVTAFDLALLWLAAEDAAPLPAFLIHDSPREGDLGISRYDNVFAFARCLEGDTPLFQYILTTTTSPPENFRANDVVRLELRGAPASERLLRRAL